MKVSMVHVAVECTEKNTDAMETSTAWMSQENAVQLGTIR